MPKEATHWIIAERAAARLGGTRLGDAAGECPNALKMGAVFPDLPYYVSGKTDLARQAAALGNRYHGAHGEDTYDVLREMLEALAEDDAPAHRAMLVGVASHLCADAAFHPFVYYETGNYYDPDPARRSRAVRDHRRFEGMLDVATCGGLREARQYRAKLIWAKLERPSGDLLEWAARRQRHEGCGTVLETANRTFLAAQDLFVQPFAAWLARGMTPMLPARTQELAALFHRRPSRRFRRLISGEFNYRNPVTGEACRATVESLLEQAVERSVALCRALELAIGSGGAGAFGLKGPSLNFGIVGAGVDQARYFSAVSEA